MRATCSVPSFRHNMAPHMWTRAECVLGKNKTFEQMQNGKTDRFFFVDVCFALSSLVPKMLLGNDGNARAYNPKRSTHYIVYSIRYWSIDRRSTIVAVRRRRRCRHRLRRQWEVVNSKFEQETNFKMCVTEVHVICIYSKTCYFRWQKLRARI